MLINPPHLFRITWTRRGSSNSVRQPKAISGYNDLYILKMTIGVFKTHEYNVLNLDYLGYFTLNPYFLLHKNFFVLLHTFRYILVLVTKVRFTQLPVTNSKPVKNLIKLL